MTKKILWTALVVSAVATAQWVGPITEGQRPMNPGVERTGTTVKVWCGIHERTFPFTTWPPFDTVGEEITSTKVNQGKLFACTIGFDGSNMKADCALGEVNDPNPPSTLVACLDSTVIP